ncbi:MAG: metal-dependent hydrolase [Pseudomonadota bacterium]
MDNLTHGLTGAVLGQLGLKKKTGLGMVTLIIAANLPDVDALAGILGGHQSLALRRGVTHGPFGILLLPILLTGIMVWFDRWQGKRGKRPPDRLPVHPGWLLMLAWIGALSHSTLDILNSYGVRFLEPFSDRWFYGDTIFIIDIWIWAALIIGLWLSLRREKQGKSDWQRTAWFTVVAVSAYIFANGLITGKAEADTAIAVEQQTGERPVLVVANPVPFIFWRREMLWQMTDENGTSYGEGMFHLFGNTSPKLNEKLIWNEVPAEKIALARAVDPDVDAYLFWSRMPVLQDLGETANGTAIRITDMRFRDPLVQDRFGVNATVPTAVDQDIGRK